MKYLPSITSPSDPPSGLARGLSWFAVVAMVLAVGALIDGGWFLEDSVIHETSIQPEKDIEQEWVAQRALLVGADMGSTRAKMARAIGHRPVFEKLHPRLPGGLLVNAWVAVFPRGWVSATALVALAVGVAWMFDLSERLSRRRIPLVIVALYLTSHPFVTLIDHRATVWVSALLVFGGWLALRRNDFWGGALLALAAALRPWAGLCILYLVLRRRWRAAAVAGGGFILLNLVALALPNISIVGSIASLSTPTEMLTHTDNESLVGGLALAGLPMGVALGAAAVLILACLAWSLRLSFDRGFGVVLAVATLAAPTVWGHYWVVLVPLVSGHPLGGLALATIWYLGHMGPGATHLAGALGAIFAALMWARYSRVDDRAADSVAASV